MIAAPYHTAWKLYAKLRRAMVKHRGREDGACLPRLRKEGANGVAGTGRRRSERRFFADLWRSSQVMAGAVLT